MIEQQQAIKNFQSEYFNLYVELANQLTSLSDYLTLIEQCCSRHLGIEKCFFMVCEGESLRSITHGTAKELNMTFPMALIDSYFYQQSCVPIPYFLAEQGKYQEYDWMMQLQKDNELLGIMLFKSSAYFHEISQGEQMMAFVDLFSKLLSYSSYINSLKIDGYQFRKLFNVTDLFHSTMDMDRIIENVLLTVEENFPEFTVDLILSNDQDRHTTIKVKPFDYLSERPSTIEAFVSGEITSEYAMDLEARLLNVPIKGRQATYGILQIGAPPTYIFTREQKEFIRLLSTASGNALENAKLYHQSHRLISDLQLINETTHRLKMKLNIHDMLGFLKNQLIKSFQPMEVCFVFIEDGEEDVMNESTGLFKTADSELYIQYVKKHFSQTQDPLFVADLGRIVMKDVQYKSIMAIPMLFDGQINGYSIVLHEESYFFSFDSFKLMQSLIHHSSLAIYNSILRNKLQEMVERDHLTQLYARSYLDEYVEASLMRDYEGMFMLIDIDNFKCVNDTFGHQVGDEVLVQISEQLKRMVAPDGICARWGGEELAVYLPNIEQAEAMQIATHIVDEIPLVTTPPVTISAGLITWHEQKRPEFQSIFSHADKALYVAKNNGKNQVCLFNESLLLESKKETI